MRNISIKTARQAKGITQKELARQLNIDQSAVALWEAEKNRTFPRASRLPEIAKVLSCTVDELIREE